MQVLWFYSLTVTAYAFFRGALPERRAAVVILVWFLADPTYHRLFGPAQFSTVDPGHVVMDSIEFAALTVIALRANRVWPIWAAGAELVAISGHLALAVGPQGMQPAYWGITQLPVFPQLVALMLGTIAHERRFRRIGPYRDWRTTKAAR